MKLQSYINGILSLEPDIISNNAKLILCFAFANADDAGVWHIDYREVRRFFGFPFNRRWLEDELSLYVEFLDDKRILIVDYVKHEYGAKLKNIDNPKYNPLSKLRNAMIANKLKFDFQSQRLTSTFNIEPILDFT